MKYSDNNIYVKILDITMNVLKDGFIINQNTYTAVDYPKVEGTRKGGFIVMWQGENSNSAGGGYFK